MYYDKIKCYSKEIYVLFGLAIAIYILKTFWIIILNN